MRAGLLQDGEPVLLIDRKDRRYMITLRASGSSDLRGGKLRHDDLIGTAEGRFVRTTRGESFLLVRPTLADFVLEMPRGAQIIYPKDLSVILLAADIYPGAAVLEAGTGSGALTLALLRAVGPTGRVYSYEVREEFARRARQNIERYFGPADHLVMRAQDVYDDIPDRPLDRVVLDVPEPWRVVSHATAVLRPGGILLSYLPTIPQTVELVTALRRAKAFALLETTEEALDLLERFREREGSAIAAVDFFYAAGNYSEDIIWPTPTWQQFNVTSFIDPGTTVTGIRVWGYSGGPPGPDETFYDDVSIQTAGTPSVILDLTYTSGSPVPPGGGNLLYNADLENDESVSLPFQFWCTYTQGATVVPAFGPISRVSPPGTLSPPHPPGLSRKLHIRRGPGKPRDVPYLPF